MPLILLILAETIRGLSTLNKDTKRNLGVAAIFVVGFFISVLCGSMHNYYLAHKDDVAPVVVEVPLQKMGWIEVESITKTPTRCFKAVADQGQVVCLYW